MKMNNINNISSKPVMAEVSACADVLPRCFEHRLLSTAHSFFSTRVVSSCMCVSAYLFICNPRIDFRTRSLDHRQPKLKERLLLENKVDSFALLYPVTFASFSGRYEAIVTQHHLIRRYARVKFVAYISYLELGPPVIRRTTSRGTKSDGGNQAIPAFCQPSVLPSPILLTREKQEGK